MLNYCFNWFISFSIRWSYLIEKEKSELSKAIKNLGEEPNNNDNKETIIDENKT